MMPDHHTRLSPQQNSLSQRHSSSAFSSPLLLIAGLILSLLALPGCDSYSSGGDDSNEAETSQTTAEPVAYPLTAQPNDGSVSRGVDGTALFIPLSDDETLVTLELDGGATDMSTSHPAHIHDNDAEAGGPIAFFLTPIDGTGGGGTSAQVIGRSLRSLTDFDGYVNVHESASTLSTILSQGNVGANAEGTRAAALELVSNPRRVEYDLAAQPNDGLLPRGVDGTVTFREFTAEQTLVILALNDGATGTNVSHIAHIHDGDTTTGGPIAFHLGPLDGSDAPANEGVSAKIVDGSYDVLSSYDGYVNIHESAVNPSTIISQGPIGANADNNGDSGGNDGGSPY